MSWRQLHDSVSSSRSLASVSDAAERLFWRILAQTDAWGRMRGEPVKVRVLCAPMLAWNDATVAKLLTELESVGRVQVYADGEDVCLQVVDFEKHQTRPIRNRGESRFPPPPLPVSGPLVVTTSRDSESESESDKEQDQHLATAAPLKLVKPAKERKPRAPDPLWDVLVEVFGAEAAGLERGRWNKALASIREAGGTPEQLRAAAVAYREHEMFGRLTMTPTAIASNWTLLTAAPKTEIDFRNERLLAYIAEQQKGAQA